jgi:NAD+ kinase
MHYVGVIFNPLSETAQQLAEALGGWLQNQKLKFWVGSAQEAVENPSALEGVELLVVLGGDGTVLQAMRVALQQEAPILAVALGRLNFMAELTPSQLPSSLQTIFAGGGWVDRRALIHAKLYRQAGVIAEFHALNEVVVSRGEGSHVVCVEVEIDAIPLITYRADGVLVATATGSTAYALSAGGPVVDPRSQALILVPVAAHLSPIAAMVLHEDSIITLALRNRHHAVLTIDGLETVRLQESDKVAVYRSSKSCSFVRVQPPAQFYSSLTQRLQRSLR